MMTMIMTLIDDTNWWH